jgi:hypothetical protein
MWFKCPVYYKTPAIGKAPLAEPVTPVEAFGVEIAQLERNLDRPILLLALQGKAVTRSQQPITGTACVSRIETLSRGHITYEYPKLPVQLFLTPSTSCATARVSCSSVLVFSNSDFAALSRFLQLARSWESTWGRMSSHGTPA